MKNKEFRMLQLFADPAPTDPVPPADPIDQKTDPVDPKTDPKDPKDPKEPEKKYTDEDVNKIIDRKFADWEKKRQKEVDEAKRLGELNAQEKAEYERDRYKKQLEELMEKDTLSEMSKTARGILSAKNIHVPDELLERLVTNDADKTKSAVDSFVSMFQEAVKASVAETLKGTTPKTGTAGNMTKEKILAVTNTAERQRLIRENMELFK